MNWNDHSRLQGQHAFLGASKYHWINYDAARIAESFVNYQAKERGTRLHAYAAESIALGQKLPRSKKTLNSYVNDAIGFCMTPEVVLYYSENCYGTADTIHFANNFLRIHDLKTGLVPAHMEQLFIYDALFCLEYGVKPRDSLTDAGKKRYDRDVAANKKKKDNKLPADVLEDPNRWVREDRERAKSVANAGNQMTGNLKTLSDKSMKIQSRRTEKMDLSKMTDQEMRERINRAMLEKQYDDKPVLPIESAQLEQLVSVGITIVTSLVAWWKNNSFTQEALAADVEYERQRKLNGK